MCGIAGFVGNGDRNDIQKMTEALVHRGPDGEGYFDDLSTGIYLGHRRLSILDVKGGHQPMWNEDGKVGVIFNGEIYNHRELRSILESKGHIFASDHSDTEVLVHGYEEWGADLPSRLNGMFAFCIFDRTARRLFLARDRFGEKPLFYMVHRNLFAFASEMTSLMRHSQISPSVDPNALKKFFAYGFFPTHWTPYQGILKLPAGNSAVYHIDSKQLTIKPFWEFCIEPFETIPKKAEEEWSEEIASLLSAAVKRRLESDVPLGFLLSGGVDSSAVTALAAQFLPTQQLKSFTIGFDEQSFDETTFAQRAADLVGTDHSVDTFRLNDARDLIPELLGRLDEPLGDSSILPTYLVCAFTRKSVTVALTGDGSDELFAGYDPFKALKIAEHYQRLVPRPLHSAICHMASRLPYSDKNMSFDFKVRRALRGVSYPAKLWNPVWLGALPPNEISELFSEPVDVDDLFSEAIDIWDRSATKNPIDRALEFYTRLYLTDDILVKSDRASMLNSLELRAPFLDNDLVDFVRRIPAAFKYRNGQTKFILKRALEKILPADILERKKKGFGIPLNQWLRQLPTPDNSANGGASVPGLNEQWLADKWKHHQNSHGDYRHGLWCWLALRHTVGNQMS
jgi:asparagine synthase (glutamine-hydrolysing)